MNIFIVGVGMGDTKYLTKIAEEKIKNADIIIGAKRVAEPYVNEKKVFFEYETDKIKKILDDRKQELEQLDTLVKSRFVELFGNPISNSYGLPEATLPDLGEFGRGVFFSGAKKLKEEFPNAEIFAGISCVSYFCAKIGMSYDDMNIVSMHGRNCNIVSEVRENEKTFVLLGENPCDKLCRYGFENAEVYIGENLSYENEKILHGKARDFRDTKLDSLSVAVIINNEYDKCTKIGINDSEFVTGNAPMTKSEVRAVSISKLEIKYDDICYDIGAGTGSVSIEMALLCGKGKVYAIEKKAEAAELIKQNALKFHADNIEIICADAPNGMDGLPKADKVFIGGSSGNLYEIIEKCDCKKVVVNAITLETLSLAQESFEKLGYEYEVTQICASRGRKVGGYNMMTAQNPVFIICGEKL